MNIIKRVRVLLRTSASRLKRIERATHYLMNHVGMIGWCECVATHDADGRAGYLLIVHTHQRIPSVDREEFRRYFRRKLFDLGELGSMSLMLFIRDADDLTRARHQVTRISSTRIASVIAAANDYPTDFVASARLAEMRVIVRERLATRRQQREKETAYVPLVAAPLTDLGAL